MGAATFRSHGSRIAPVKIGRETRFYALWIRLTLPGRVTTLQEPNMGNGFLSYFSALP